MTTSRKKEGVMASDYKEMDSEKKSTHEEYGTGQG